MATQSVIPADILQHAQAALTRLGPILADVARLNADIARQHAIKDQLAILAETRERIARTKEELAAVDAAIAAGEAQPTTQPTTKAPRTPPPIKNPEGVMPLLGLPDALRRVIAYLTTLVENARPVKLLYKPEEAAWALGFTFSAFNQSDWHKRIKVCKVGNLNRYRPEDLKTFTDNLPRSLPH